MFGTRDIRVRVERDGALANGEAGLEEPVELNRLAFEMAFSSESMWWAVFLRFLFAALQLGVHVELRVSAQ